jgi:hypothetical protein
MSDLDAIRDHLTGLPIGKVKYTDKLAEVLSSCWDQLKGGGEGSMAGWKLKDRVENVHWRPPNLSFTIERHGGMEFGSVYAELKNWVVDVDAGTAEDFDGGRRQKRPKAPAIKIKPLAQEIIGLVRQGEDDPRFRWDEERRIITVDVNAVFPGGDSPKQTTEGRRERLFYKLIELMREEGWTRVGKHRLSTSFTKSVT